MYLYMYIHTHIGGLGGVGTVSSPQTGKSFRFVRPCVPCERCEAVRVRECECLLNAGAANTKKSCSSPSSPRMLFCLFWPAGAWVTSDLHDNSENLKFYLAWVLRHLSGFAGSPCV